MKLITKFANFGEITSICELKLFNQIKPTTFKHCNIMENVLTYSYLAIKWLIDLKVDNLKNSMGRIFHISLLLGNYQ